MATGANATPLDFPSKKRKRSRWNQDTMEQKTVIPGMPTVIPPGLTREQERAYIGPLPLSPSTIARGSGLTPESSAPAKSWKRSGTTSSQRWLRSIRISSHLQITNLQQHV
ncbi:SF1 isoform 15 [Pongo abelii]|uniref:SF1 isoform 15 n=1 Tax=Pongo abelii TaxID=9601 RepID=A0A2J8TYT6_PONAB|nr:SF1 isoform 3 [Pongo abelii]PNJ38183.1 SF1 isoform 15 [Pongo abelii]